MDMLAQAGLQNGMAFSTVMKLYTTKSLAEKQRTVEADEKRRMEQAQQQQQQEYQLKQQEIQANMQIAQQKAQLEYQMHREKLEADIQIATINSFAEQQRMSIMNHDNAEANDIEREKMAEDARQFDSKMQLEEKKLKADTEIKKEQIKKSNSSK
jgi:hypothetical protein